MLFFYFEISLYVLFSVLSKVHKTIFPVINILCWWVSSCCCDDVEEF